MAQDAFGTEGAVIIAFILRLAMRSGQDAMQAQELKIMGKLGRLPLEARQDAKGVGGVGQYRPP